MTKQVVVAIIIRTYISVNIIMQESNECSHVKNLWMYASQKVLCCEGNNDEKYGINVEKVVEKYIDLWG